MKILHIAPTPFFSNRGCHIRIRNEIDGVHRHGMQIILCTYHHGENIEGFDIRRISRVFGYTKTDAGYSPYKFIADILLFFLTLKVAWKEKPSLIHGHLHEGALLGWAVKSVLFWRKLSLVMDMQGSLSGELDSYGAFSFFPQLIDFFAYIEKIICKLPQVIICSSREGKDFLLERCNVERRRIHLLQDVVPDDFFIQADKQKWREVYGVPIDQKVIMYTGSLLPGKGLDYLLQAIKILHAKRKDVFFILAGYPKGTAEEYVVQHNLQECCLIPGEIKYDELSSLLAVADLAVDPKTADAGEASGKILHYMAAGLPVVCFDSPNNKYFLGSSAFYARTGSLDSLVMAFERGLADPEAGVMYGKAGQKKIKQYYSLDAAGRKLAALYTLFLYGK